MIESEIKEFANLIARWSKKHPVGLTASSAISMCAIELENVLDSLAPPVDPVVAGGDFHEDENGKLEPGTDDNMLERFDDSTCPECGQKLKEP